MFASTVPTVLIHKYKNIHVFQNAVQPAFNSHIILLPASQYGNIVFTRFIYNL